MVFPKETQAFGRYTSLEGASFPCSSTPLPPPPKL